MVRYGGTVEKIVVQGFPFQYEEFFRRIVDRVLIIRGLGVRRKLTERAQIRSAGRLVDDIPQAGVGVFVLLDPEEGGFPYPDDLAEGGPV